MVRRYYRVNATEESRGDPVGLAIAEHIENDLYRIGFSRCSKGDHFNKEKARKVAENRLNSGKYCLSYGQTRVEDILPEKYPEDMNEVINWVVEREHRKVHKNEKSV